RKSSATSERPSLHTRPGRRWNVYVLPSGVSSQRYACPGIGASVCGSSRVSPSNSARHTRPSGCPAARPGSIVSGSGARLERRVPRGGRGLGGEIEGERAGRGQRGGAEPARGAVRPRRLGGARQRERQQCGEEKG